MLKRLVLFISIVATIAGICTYPVNAFETSVDIENNAEYVRGEIIVKYKDWKKRNKNVLTQRNGKVKKELTRSKSIVYEIDDNEIISLKQQAKLLDDNIEFAEPNYIVKITATPLDTLYATDQKVFWDGVSRYEPLLNAWIQEDMRIDHAWDTTKGSSTTKIAVIDTGINSNHQELVGKVVASANFINPALSANDDNGHGTAVASVIAANTNFSSSTTGMAGVCPNCVLLNAKVIGANGSGTVGDMVEALYWAKDQGAKVINMSLGANVNSESMQIAIEYVKLGGNNVTIVGGSGNNGLPLKFYPAAYASVIGVGSLSNSGQRSSFSNYGDWVDIMAYGESIRTAKYDTNNGYTLYQGTSFATPFVSGVAALMYSRSDLPANNKANYIRSSIMHYGRPTSISQQANKVLDAMYALTQPLVMYSTTTRQHSFYLYQDNNNNGKIDITDTCIRNRPIELSRYDITPSNQWTILSPVNLYGTPAIFPITNTTDLNTCTNSSSNIYTLLIGTPYRLRNNTGVILPNNFTPDYPPTGQTIATEGVGSELFGDCNGSGTLEAGDLTALSLEIFDGDGDNWLQTLGGTYAFPRFCDANRDSKVDAGDLSCISQKIFNPAFTCGAP